ncbi:SDR family NAD(P)-dependent oxidoreductase [Sinimarinibacterium sp. CAU 1509]|uniref:SDR family NAD(P)-dependent oxidoreductase n=1 Tax=Sinimarinibacterium sp. CAU 1509 TaxID=2562283 RepID=UPI0010AD05BC|nr:SDR family NAD(P)-dependent oxidoreductase [Sinimarinibacterium sp. CAU 1509]TJY62200.1 SDR family NAD(P)-dependent oxidoreductase [Sinimarinibacterium sp. CAU 1509]
MTAIPVNYAPPSDLLAGRRILITGAGDGLGRAAALACAAHGATVVLLGRTVKKLEAVYDAIEAAGGSAPAIYPLNLGGASWKDYADLASTIETEIGGIDGVLHCAAQFKQFMPLTDVDPKEWIESLQVNLTAPFALTRHLLPLLEQAADASVVFVSDRHGREVHAYDGIYGISKAALEHLMQTWAAELPQTGSVRMNSYDPGPLRTGHRLKGYPGEIVEQAPVPETATPALLWLLGPDSRGISGSAF